MTRAEHVMDGVFCVFAKGVCSLSLSPDHKAMLFSLSEPLYSVSLLHKKTRRLPGFH